MHLSGNARNPDLTTRSRPHHYDYNRISPAATPLGQINDKGELCMHIDKLHDAFTSAAPGLPIFRGADDAGFGGGGFWLPADKAASRQ